MEYGLRTGSSETDGERLLREAGELAAGVDAQLDILSLVTPEEFESDIETLETIASEESTSFTDRTPERYATDIGEQLVGDHLGNLDVEYSVDGQVFEGAGRAISSSRRPNGTAVITSSSPASNALRWENRSSGASHRALF